MMNVYSKAITKADEVRRELGLNMFEPVNVIDACIKLGITVRIVDINMEGLYVSREDELNPTIILSNQRPFPRRNFTCAHELGHHFFKHGVKLDVLPKQENTFESSNIEEQLVDSFAGALLMPLAGVQHEFKKRNWTIEKSSALDFYIIASVFNIGYQTLITHCKVNRLISEEKAKFLSKYTPALILKDKLNLSTMNKSHFKIVDSYYKPSVIDIEVTNYLILPLDVELEETSKFEKCDTPNNLENVYVATKSGITRALSTERGTNYFVRTQNLGYIGLAEYRHLEN